MKKQIIFENEYQTHDVETMEVERWLNISISEDESQEDYEKRIQNVIEERFNKPDNNPGFGSARTATLDGETMLVDKDTSDILGCHNGNQNINRYIAEEDRQKFVFSDGSQNEDRVLYKAEAESIMNRIRKGIHSIWWKPEMVVGAKKCRCGIPYCPTTAEGVPKDLITYTEAKKIYKTERRKGNKDFTRDVFVCFYEDDYKFDSTCGIWFRNKQAYKILKHFAGIITPDFSTYFDFPDPLKRWNTYRMRAFGYWYGKICGKQVINNVRGDVLESWEYCFEGIPKNDIVAIGTVASDVRKLYYRPIFEAWLEEMVFVLKPKIIIVYGSSNYPCFDRLREQGILIKTYRSKTARYYAGGESNE